ncbi:MAG: response regulator [Cyclobacteriaceae bacterium]|nr:response regulator [Cyclobacteriaceae bacterium]
MRKKVLIVDDSLYMRKLIKNALIDEGYEIVGEAHNGDTAIELALNLLPDLITLDNILPDMIGADVLKTLKDENVVSKVLMISAVGQKTVIEEGIKLGATEYLVKPFTSEDLVEAVNRILK